MNRVVSLIFVFSSLISICGQEDLCEIVIKGKKQGVKLTSSDQWLIPLGKQRIVEPFENLFIKVDKKNRKVQAFYKDEYFDRTTESSSHLFFGEYYGMNDVLRFEDGTINVSEHSFTKPRFYIPMNGHRGPGCGFFQDLLLIAANADSAGLYIIEIIDSKNNIVDRFENVEYCIEQGRLLIGKTKQKKYDPVYQTSYDVETVEVYEVSSEGIIKKGSYDKNDEKSFENVLNHIRGYVYSIYAEPLFDQTVPQKRDYEAFIKTNYKTDSAGKFPLIISDETGVYFANEKDRYHLSAEGLWEKTEKEYYNELHFDGGHSVFESRREENLELITSKTYYDEVFLTDDDGNIMYDASGFEIYTEIPPRQECGVWNWETNTWLIPREYSDIHLINGFIVGHRDVENLKQDGLDQVEIFDLVGNRVASVNGLSQIEILEAIYPEAKADSIIGSYQLYKLDKNGKQAIVDFSTFYFSLYEIASFDDGVLPGSFNAVTYSYLSQKGGILYFNEYDVEIGVTAREIKGDFGGLVFDKSSGYRGAYLSDFREEESGDLQFNILSGIKKTSKDNCFVVYNNIPIEFIEQNRVPKYDPIYGDYMYDANGNQVYDHVYPRTGEKISATGLWSLSNNKWVINPKFNQIQESKDGFLCVSVELKKDNDSYNGEELQDSVTMSYFSSSFEPLQEGVQLDDFLNNTSNFKYFVAKEDLDECIRKPTIINENLYLQDSYSNYWFSGTNGLSLVRKNKEKLNIELSAKGLDWIYESKYYSYGRKKDSIIIMDNSELKIPGSVSVPISAEFEIIETMNGIYIFSEEGNYHIPAVEFPPLFSEAYDNKDITEQVIGTIKGNDKEVICGNKLVDELFYGEYYLDDYGGSSKVILKNDLVWKKDRDKWEIGIIANAIEKTPFGYFVSNNYFLSGSSLPWTFYNEDGNVNYEYNQGSSFVDQNFKSIDDIPVSSYYGSSPLNGYDHLFVVKYGSPENPEVMAIVSQEGKVIAKEIYSYDIKDGVLEYTVAVADEWGSVPKVDDNGNEVRISVSIK